MKNARDEGYTKGKYIIMLGVMLIIMQTFSYV